MSEDEPRKLRPEEWELLERVNDKIKRGELVINVGEPISDEELARQRENGELTVLEETLHAAFAYLAYMEKLKKEADERGRMSGE